MQSFGFHGFFWSSRHHDPHILPFSVHVDHLQLFCFVGWYLNFKDGFIGWDFFIGPLLSLRCFETLQSTRRFFFFVFLRWLSTGIDGSTDDNLISFDSPFSGNMDEDYSEIWKDLPPIEFIMNPDLDPDPLFTAEIDNDGTSSIFADPSQGDCSFGISLLPDGLKKSRRGTTPSCPNPGSSNGNSDTVPGNSGVGVGGTGMNVDPKVAPYLNIETMELNEICPPQSLINQYHIPVCSSSVKGYTKKYPPVLPTHWQLRDAQLSKCILFSLLVSKKKRDSARLSRSQFKWDAIDRYMNWLFPVPPFSHRWRPPTMPHQPLHLLLRKIHHRLPRANRLVERRSCANGKFFFFKYKKISWRLIDAGGKNNFSKIVFKIIDIKTKDTFYRMGRPLSVSQSGRWDFLSWNRTGAIFSTMTWIELMNGWMACNNCFGNIYNNVCLLPFGEARALAYWST